MALAWADRMIDEPIKDDPRNDEAPLPHVDDPGIRKGPLKDPPTNAPQVDDPPAEPHVPGDPAPAAEDPAPEGSPSPEKPPASA